MKFSSDNYLMLYKERHKEVYESQLNRPQAISYFDRLAFDLIDPNGYRRREIEKRKEIGGKVVATFCLFVPEEIIIASGSIYLKLDAAFSFAIPEAETIIPREICPMIKSFLGAMVLKVPPILELVDFAIGETSCDGKKKIWELLNDFIPTYVMELPQKKYQIDRELWLREVFQLKEKMEVETRTKITMEKLAHAIDVVNKKRKALARLQSLRAVDPPPISGRETALVFQIAPFDDPERFTLQVNKLCDELDGRIEKREGIGKLNKPRIMIAGSPMGFMDWKLLHIIESNGAIVVCEDTCQGARYFLEPCVRSDRVGVLRQLRLIADRYLNLPCPCFTPGYCGVIQIKELIKEYKIDGVIYYVLQFCHGFNIEYHKIEKILNGAGIPVLKIQTDYSEEDTEQLRTRIEAFLERIKQ